MQVRRPAHPLEVVVAVEAAGDDDRIDVLALTEQVDHRRVDQLVRRVVEVLRRELTDDLHDGVRTEQHRAEHALLRLTVVRRLTVLAERRSGVAAVAVPAPDRTPLACRDQVPAVLRLIRLGRRHVVVVETGATES